MMKIDDKSKWTDVTLIYDNGVFSVIAGFYDGGASPAYGVGWNNIPSDFGNIPHPDRLEQQDWFVLPPVLVEPILHALLSDSLKKLPFNRWQSPILKTLRDVSLHVCPNTIQRAIVLFGASNTGKTMTLNALIDLLAAEATKPGQGEIVATDSGTYNPTTKTGDRCVAIRVFGKLVVVETAGDEAEAVQKGIDYAHRFNADIVVSATRKRSDSSSWSAFFDFVSKAGVYYEAVEKIWLNDATLAQSQAQKQAEELFVRIRLA